MFAIIDLKTIRSLSDRELKVYSTLLAMSHGGNGIIKFSDLCETTGKGKTQIWEILNLLIKKGLVKRLDRGKYEIKFELNLTFEIDLTGFNGSEQKKIAKIIKQKGLTKEQVEQILNYLRAKKPKDKVKYFGWLVNNLGKITRENEKIIEEIIVKGVDNFYSFQQFLNENKINYKFEVIEKPKQANAGFFGGVWKFEGYNIKKIYNDFNKTKNLVKK
ncbi:MAG: hypothetical protein QXW01_03750 [Candidatus Aenigmatarchaeota archaeon]